MFHSIAAAVVLALLCPHRDCCDDPGPVKVTVVVVLASTENTGVDPKLVELAREVQKRDPKLIGYTLVSSEGKSIKVGEGATFPLVDKQELKVKVERSKDENGRVSLTIRPPELGEVTYACTCDKFFPVVTPYRTKKGETLIIAVMAKPCTTKK
ncbi:MAG TPA: hypothetical protein VKE74_22980 [Gemmataceae bacterium]|nr:hypothetical protein [Gemmataceae bacterium]